MGGHPWGVQNGQNGPKSQMQENRQKNGQKMMNRHKKSPNFLFVINASILFTPHFIKEMKKMSEDSQIIYQKSQNMAKQ